mmetsp:Transcript_69846/g.130506  ORF Transcript_69846/g.130506 Transcript_69846/m.130506 type:complete len:283 (+) Transcript_69846:148-996(+)
MSALMKALLSSMMSRKPSSSSKRATLLTLCRVSTGSAKLSRRCQPNSRTAKASLLSSLTSRRSLKSSRTQKSSSSISVLRSCGTARMSMATSLTALSNSELESTRRPEKTLVTSSRSCSLMTHQRTASLRTLPNSLKLSTLSALTSPSTSRPAKATLRPLGRKSSMPSMNSRTCRSNPLKKESRTSSSLCLTSSRPSKVVRTNSHSSKPVLPSWMSSLSTHWRSQKPSLWLLPNTQSRLPKMLTRSTMLSTTSLTTSRRVVPPAVTTSNLSWSRCKIPYCCF